jgi:hypothetical protein
MSSTNSVDIVHAFWDEVWNAHDPEAVDRFAVLAVRDGKLLCSWVERSSFELHRRLVDHWVPH